MQLYTIILLAVIISFHPSAQSQTVDDCRYFNIGPADSVCLDVADNLDTAKVAQLITEGKKDLLIIFTGWVMSEFELLREKNLTNPKIRKALQGFKIIRLYVDDRAKARPDDQLTIGAKNMLYQGHRFNVLSQPFFVIIKNGRIGCSSGYMPQESMLKFLVDCQKD